MENKITPKQAWEELKFQVGNITYFTRDLQPTTRKVRDSGLFEIIEKALAEHEKQKQILEVLKKKEVDVSYIKSCENYFDYTMALGLAKEDLQEGEFINVLTKTEFNLLKEWLK